jgi:hypothetical protein
MGGHVHREGKAPQSAHLVRCPLVQGRKQSTNEATAEICRIQTSCRRRRHAATAATAAGGSDAGAGRGCKRGHHCVQLWGRLCAEDLRCMYKIQ